MEHIAISVIVPIYNTKPYLAECIESILAQKINVPIEVLLIDDGSTDGCGEVCDKYAARDERVRVIHQENQGLSAARNAGIDAAKGRYYSFIDSDDVVLPRFLQTLYDACEEHDAYMSLCSVEDVQEDGKSCDPAYFTRPTQEGVFCGKDLLNEFYTPTARSTPSRGTRCTAPRSGNCCITPKAACMRMTSLHTACSGAATRSSASTSRSITTACATAASAARTYARRRSTPWTVWPTAIVFMSRTTRTARSSTRPMQPAGGGICSSARRCASTRRPSWSRPSARSSF
ncbi:glycosyltransferase [Gemmiger formicilis]|nr:glycosyltransferase [Gemmiger formicilis]